MQYSFEPMLQAIFEAAKEGKAIRVKDEHACMTLVFKNAEGTDALRQDIKQFLSTHADPTQECLQLVSGRVDAENNTAQLKLRSPFAQSAYMDSDMQTQILENTYINLISDRRFQGNCMIAGVTSATTPRQTRYKLKGLQAG